METILFVSPTGTLDNGAEISVVHLMKYLVKEGYRVINVAPNNSPFYAKECQEAGIIYCPISVTRWWWEEAPGALIGSEALRAASYRENIQFIRQLIEKYQVKVVVSNTVNVFQGALAAAIEKVRHFWMIHEFPTGEFSYYREKIEFIDYLSDEIFAVSGELVHELQPLFEKRKIHEFSPFTEIPLRKLKVGQKRRIVSVGRITERKNQIELLEAYQKIARPEIELVFIGAWDEEYKRQCDAFIRKHQLKNIQFMGNQQDPWSEVTDQDLCVFPSAMETFGLVYVEALLNGSPVILSDNPGHISAYELFKFGDVYPSKNSEELAAKISLALEHFDEKKALAESQVPVFRKKYSVPLVYENILRGLKEEPKDKESNVISEIRNLLLLNEPKSKLAKLEYRIRYKISQVKYKLFKK